MEYKKLKDTWVQHNEEYENYSGPVTLSLPEWNKYVSKGYNTLLGSGGVIPGNTENIPFVGNGAVYSGNVRQGYMSGW